MRSRRWWWLGAALALYLVYTVSPVRMRTDSIWSIPIALSVLHEGDLDEYRQATDALPHGLAESQGSRFSTFPVGASLVAVPFLALADAFAAVPWPIEAVARQADRWREASWATGDVPLGFFDTTELLVASFCAVVAVLCFFVLVSRFATPRTALFLTVVLAVGSPVYSTATRGLWQHGPAMMFVLAAWAVATRGTHLDSVWRDAAAGALAGAALVCRPTVLVPLVLLAFFVARHRSVRALAVSLVGSLAVLVPWLVSTHAIWGTWLPACYRASRLEASPALFAEALLGNLISPSRGLLVFLPLVVLLPLAWRAAREPGERRTLAWGSIVVLLVHWVTISRFPHWWGGHAYGPRLFTDVVPFALLGLAPWLDEVLSARGPRRTAVFALAAACVVIHTRGAVSKATWAWNLEPVSVDEAPARLWDWRDPQFLR